MKKDRNCNSPYPVYPAYQGMYPGGPNMMEPMQFPMMQPQMYNTGTNGITNNTIEQQLNTLEQRMNLLDKRISTLETMLNSSNSINYSNTGYNSSNYQML